MKKKIIYLSLAGLLGVAAIGCSKSSGSSYTTPPAKTPVTPTATNPVSIANFAFSPATINVKVGDTVTWTNTDGVAHTVTDLGGSFDSGSIGSGKTYQRIFATAGTYNYHCTIHPMMPTATVVVK